jgi:hypothetical protein
MVNFERQGENIHLVAVASKEQLRPRIRAMRKRQQPQILGTSELRSTSTT